jgi:hypothetical protein
MWGEYDRGGFWEVRVNMFSIAGSARESSVIELRKTRAKNEEVMTV